MATISKLNVQITANANPLEAELKRISTSINNLNPKGEGLNKFTDKAADGFKEVDKKINDTIKNLYKMRAELAKGAKLNVGQSGQIGGQSTQQALASIEKLKGELAANAAKNTVVKSAVGQTLAQAATLGVIAQNGSIDQKVTDARVFAKYIKQQYGVNAPLRGYTNLDDGNSEFRYMDKKYSVLNNKLFYENPQTPGEAKELPVTLAQANRAIKPLTEKAADLTNKFTNLGSTISKRILGPYLGEKLSSGVGNIGAGAAAFIAAGRLVAGQRSNVRDFNSQFGGVSSATFSNSLFGKSFLDGAAPAAFNISQIPGIKSASEAVGEFFSLFGADSSISNISAEVTLLQQGTERLAKALSDLKETMRTTSMIGRDYRNQSLSADQQFGQMNSGGAAGRIFGARIAGDNSLRSAQQARDDQFAQIEQEKIRKMEEVAKRRAELQKLSTSGTKKEQSEAQNQLKLLDSEQNRYIQLLDDRKTVVEKGYGEITQKIARNTDQQIKILSGLIPNTAAIADSFEALDKAISTAGLDEFGKQLAEFKQLNPAAADLALFTQRLSDLDKKLKQGEIAAELKELGKQARYAFLSDDEKVRAALLDKGATAGQLGQAEMAQKQIRAGSAYREAIKDYEKYADEVRKLDAELNQLREKDALKRIEIEANAERDQKIQALKDAGVTGAAFAEAVKKINEAAAGTLEKKKQIELQKQANDILEQLKQPKDTLVEQLNKIGRALKDGRINEDQATQAIQNARSDFAKSLATNRPEALDAGSGAAQRAAFISAGRVFDSQNPQLLLQKEANAILQDIRDGVLDNSDAAVEIGII